jgi:sigma-B regulation protein RsbU (phosphoserine phosphatase)
MPSRLRFLPLLLGAAALQVAAAQPKPLSHFPVRYHFGDNPAWANPNFDDSSWIEAPSGLFPLPPFRSDGIIWVRFRVPVPPHPAASLALRLSRPSLTEASQQVFLDGTPLGHNGKLPPAPEAVVLQNSTFAVAATIPVEEPFATVALRLWYPPTARYGGGEDSIRSQIGFAAALNEQQRADRLALILSWVPVISLNGLLALVGIGLLGLWFWSRRRELLWFSLLLVLYPLSLSSLPVLMSPMFPSRLSAELVALGNATSMFVTVEFLWIMFALRNRWLRILLHSAWVAFSAAGLLAAFATSGSSHVAWALLVATVAVSVFNLGTLFIDLRFLVTGPNRLVAAGMAVIPVASSLLFWLHLDPTDIFGIPHLDLFDTGFLLAGAFLSIMLIRRALAASREGAHLRMELAAAREVQQNLVPAAVPRIDGFRVETAYLPAQEVGGDFFQILPQSDGSKLLIVGDVSGKGLKAAMTGTLALGAIRNLAQENLAPSQILFRLNLQLADASNGGFITCLAALIASDGNITLANAGHLAPYCNGEEVSLDSGLPLGIAPDATYAESIIRLAPNDRLTFLSDGVVEARNSQGELFGFDRTRQISTQSAEAIAATAQQFGQEDDITVLTLQFLDRSHPKKAPIGLELEGLEAES